MKLTSSNAKRSSRPTLTGFAGLGSTGVSMIARKFSSDASVSRHVLMIVPSSCSGPKMKNE